MAVFVQAPPPASGDAFAESSDASNTTLPYPIHPQFIPVLDADFIEYHNTHFAPKPASHTIDIAEIRKNQWKYASPWEKDFSHETFVRDLQIRSLDEHIFNARCYYPDPAQFGPGPYPIHVNFHGGGYVFGGLKSDAEICMLVRNKVGILVVDIEYRLAPENFFGKGHEDAWAAIKWLHEHGHEINGNSASISIGGISAGGAISAVIQQLARDANIPLKLAFISVPITQSHSHLQKPSESPYKSFSDYALAPSLNWARLNYFKTLSLPTTAAAQEFVDGLPEFYSSPIKGNVTGVCPTFIAIAEIDPLCDEGEAYAVKLVEAGVKTTVRRYSGVTHPFMHMRGLKKTNMYDKDLCTALKAAHEV